MKIETSTPKNISEIFQLYGLATEYQKRIFPENTWPTFERELVETEIQEQRQFKMVIDGHVACVWAITFTDPQIWEERNSDPSIYIHRIATNPSFRGPRLSCTRSVSPGLDSVLNVSPDSTITPSKFGTI